MRSYYADLHVHSNFSDGIESIENILENADKKGVKVISITDHDTVEGYDVINHIHNSICIIPGIELTVSSKLHVLGYFINPLDPELRRALNKMKMDRARWIIKLVENLKKKYDISILKLRERYGEVTLNSVVQYLANIPGCYLEKKYIYENIIWNKEQPFPAFGLDEAIELIKRCGGIPVLAHPSLILIENYEEPEKVLDNIVFKGIQGLEIYHVANERNKYVDFLKVYAKKRGLIETGGSDFHGMKNKNTYIGEYGLTKKGWEALVDKCL